MAKKISNVSKKSKKKTGKKKVAASKNKTKKTKTKTKAKKTKQTGGEKTIRSFKANFNGVEFGRFMARMPRQAASKALTSLKKYNDDFDEDGKNVFYLKETTRGCNRKGKLFKYEGEIVELDEPKIVRLGERDVEYTHKNQIHSLGKCARNEVYEESESDESEDPELIDSDDDEISDVADDSDEDSNEESDEESEEKVVKKSKNKKKAKSKAAKKKGGKKKVRKA